MKPSRECTQREKTRWAAAWRSAARPRVSSVVADIHDDGLDAPITPRVYFPLFQRSGYELTLFYRSSVDPASLDSAGERAIHAVDPTLPVFGCRHEGCTIRRTAAWWPLYTNPGTQRLRDAPLRKMRK